MVGGSQLWILSESWDPEKIQWPSLWNVIVLKNMEKSGSRLQYFVPRHFIEQTSMRKKEVSKKNFVAVSSAFFGLLHASKAKNALPLYKALINKAFDLINYLSAFSTWQVPNPFQTWKRDWRTPGPKSWQFYPPKLKPIKIHEDEIPRRKLDLHGPKIPSSFFLLVSPRSVKKNHGVWNQQKKKSTFKNGQKS